MLKKQLFHAVSMKGPLLVGRCHTVIQECSVRLSPIGKCTKLETCILGFHDELALLTGTTSGRPSNTGSRSSVWSSCYTTVALCYLPASSPLHFSCYFSVFIRCFYSQGQDNTPDHLALPPTCLFPLCLSPLYLFSESPRKRAGTSGNPLRTGLENLKSVSSQATPAALVLG